MDIRDILKLSCRIAELSAYCAHDPEGSPLKGESVSKLADLLYNNPQIEPPDLTVDCYGNLRGEWHESWDRHLAIEFTPGDLCKTVLFIGTDDGRTHRYIWDVPYVDLVPFLLKYVKDPWFLGPEDGT